MMELVAGAFSALTSGVSSAAGAVGSALGFGTGAGAAGAAAGGSSWLNILQGGLSALGAVSTISAANTQASGLETQAADVGLQQGVESAAAQERRASLKRQLAEDIASRDAAYAAGNIDLSFGTPSVARAQANDAAQRALAQDGSTERFRFEELDRKKAALRQQARSTRRAGLFQGLGQIGGTALDMAERG
jgi:hypothetical protein